MEETLSIVKQWRSNLSSTKNQKIEKMGMDRV